MDDTTAAAEPRASEREQKCRDPNRIRVGINLEIRPRVRAVGRSASLGGSCGCDASVNAAVAPGPPGEPSSRVRDVGVRSRVRAWAAVAVGLVTGCSASVNSTREDVPALDSAAGARSASTALAPPGARVSFPRLQTTVSTIAFGSCLDQRLAAPILGTIVEAEPDLFVFLGDNVYADAEYPEAIAKAYADLGRRPDYQSLARAVPIVAVWDDHDYGRDDAGREYPLKEVSKRIMLDFFGEPEGSPRRRVEGNYDAFVLGPPRQRIQVILLDTRWSRSPLRPSDEPGRRYAPVREPGATILGDEQWRWFGEQLREPARLRIVVSSIQVLSGEHGFESWSLFPAERERLINVLAESGPVVVVSGDRHRGEISRLDLPGHGNVPLFDLTTSSLNRPFPNDEPNRYRLGRLVVEPNFGVVRVDWTQNLVSLELVDEDGEIQVRETLPLPDAPASTSVEAAAMPAHLASP